VTGLLSGLGILFSPAWWLRLVKLFLLFTQ
jgi:hypothetical protein